MWRAAGRPSSTYAGGCTCRSVGRVVSCVSPGRPSDIGPSSATMSWRWCGAFSSCELVWPLWLSPDHDVVASGALSAGSTLGNGTITGGNSTTVEEGGVTYYQFDSVFFEQVEDDNGGIFYEVVGSPDGSDQEVEN